MASKLPFTSNHTMGAPPKAWSVISSIFTSSMAAALRFSVPRRQASYSPDDQTEGNVLCVEHWSCRGGGGSRSGRVLAAGPGLRSMRCRKAALIIANTVKGDWVEGGHFDGLYNYATLHLTKTAALTGHDPCRQMPCMYPVSSRAFLPDGSVIAEKTFVPREDGSTYYAQWTSALNAGVEPALVTITSFNEWHEGSMIEPPQVGVDRWQWIYLCRLWHAATRRISGPNA